MSRKLTVLEHVHVASPCPASWMEMEGDDRVRHCRLCRLNVYNLSEMTRDEAEKLLKKEGCLCVRYYVRRDGTILTRGCPVGLARARKRLQQVLSAVAAVFALTATLLTAAGNAWRNRPNALLSMEPFATYVRLNANPPTSGPRPTPPPRQPQAWLMGKIAAPGQGDVQVMGRRVRPNRPEPKKHLQCP